VLASTAEVVRQLLDAPSARSRRTTAPVAPPAARDESAEPRPGPVHPARLMDFLNQRLPDDVVVHVDAGNAFSWSTHHLARALPATYRVAMGLSTMCWAIGAAVGAAVACPRRTLCIVGDGSMLMSSLELTVAVQHRLPVTFVVLNDACYGMVRHGQQLSGAEPIGFELGHVAFDRLAQACGAGGLRVETEQDLNALPDACFMDDASGPWVIDVSIDRDAVSPMVERVRGLKALSGG
jgi:acetolactate synthase-1/2/3 large subunit